MLELQTSIEGRTAYYGQIKDQFKSDGYCIGSNWDYHEGSFDSVLWRDDAETIYLRLPFEVTRGELDKFDASLKFKKPYVIKHVVNVGLDSDSSSLVSGSFNQFQEPVDLDGQIHDKSKWEKIGHNAVEKLAGYL